MGLDGDMSFTTPLALILLLLLPLAAWLVWPSSRRRGAKPRSGRLGLGLRLLILALVVLSLAGTQLVRAVNDLAVVFLVDVSDSIGSDNAATAEQFVRQAVESMGPDDRTGVILFGGDALVEQPLRGSEWAGDLPPFTSRPQRIATDLAEAIRLSLALLPSDAARRLVILSDGAVTTGDTAEAARLAAASGVAIDVITLSRPETGAEIILRDVRAPTRVGQGETFRLDVDAWSTAATEATLRVLGDGTVIYEEIVRLQPGANNFAVRLRADAPAFTRYRVQLTPVGALDTYPQNNELAAYTEVVGQPRVLVVAAAGVDKSGEPLPDEAVQLVRALSDSGLSVDRVTPAELTPATADLINYAAVILVNVNARELSPRKMEALQTYVRDLGGGLVAIGGSQSFGMGGYFGTPLEETLPVNMQIDDQERFPAVSLVLVIDRSGSMAATEGGVTKIQLAAEGAIRALELLNDFDDMTIIPVDEAPDAIIGPVTSANREEAIEQMRRMGAGGGGIFVRTGLEAAAKALAASDNEVRHIIVLADGADSEQKEGVPELIEQLTAEGVTVSMVSIGAGPDTAWLQQMADLGNGRFHFTDQAANLPQIFTQETVAIQRNYVIEETFFPTQAAAGPVLLGIRETPPLHGYVGTSAKATALTSLITHLRDPLLATWQYGLGRSLAWTSDATSHWATDWVRWDGFATFWNQAVRWTFGAGAQGGLAATVRLEGETARLIVDAQANGEYLNDLALTANVVDPAGNTQAIALQPVGPGRYEGAFTPTTEGAYFIGVGSADGGFQTTAGWVLGYSPEYATLESDPALLASLAERTGGRVLDMPNGMAAVFEHNLDAASAAQPIWPWLTLVAVLLLPLDVAARRLTFTRRDWERLTNFKFRTTNKGEPTEEKRPERMAQLLRAKERKAEELRVTNDELRVKKEAPVTESAPPSAGTTRPEAPETAEPISDTPPSTDEPLAARLRKRRGH